MLVVSLRRDKYNFSALTTWVLIVTSQHCPMYSPLYSRISVEILRRDAQCPMIYVAGVFFLSYFAITIKSGATHEHTRTIFFESWMRSDQCNINHTYEFNGHFVIFWLFFSLLFDYRLFTHCIWKVKKRTKIKTIHTNFIIFILKMRRTMVNE